MYKEDYFTDDTILAKSHEFLAAVTQERQRHADLPFRPQAATLLVLDMQAYFLEEGSHAFVPSAQPIVPGIQSLIHAFEKAKRPVVRTRHLNTLKNAGMMSRWWRDLINVRSAYSQNIDPFQITNSIEIKKTQYDAFYRTRMERVLREQGTQQVVICGVMTHLCCECTARSAFMRGFEVFFTIDGTATYNEELHRSSLQTLAHGFAIPLLVEEALSGFESHAN
jgi:bifunctional isochorismate lyase/aryl carrier protein